MDPRTKDALFRFWTSIHRAVFVSSKGRVFGRAGGMRVVMLTTTGRRSGKERSTILTTPLQDGATIVLVASYGGDARHPAWFHNLRANPDVSVTLGGRTLPMRARVASPEEKDVLWPKVTAKYKGYASYQRKTDRDIPLVLLEPR